MMALGKNVKIIQGGRLGPSLFSSRIENEYTADILIVSLLLSGEMYG